MDPSYKQTDVEDRYRLTHVMETALCVRDFQQFFAWTQGPLFTLLPHEILICGHAVQGSSALNLRFFSASRYFRKEHFDLACSTRNGLIAKAIRHWRNVLRPCILPQPDGYAACDIATLDTLVRLELKNFAAHGQLGFGGSLQSWFGFSRVQNLSERTGYLLELLVPTLSATYARVVALDGAASGRANRLGGLLTAREIQVLEMVRDGLTNAQVAERLELSVMTAKNHMQNIRSKLKVRTRGQAVIEAIRLGLLRSSREEL